MPGTQHAQDAYFDRAMDLVDKAQSTARDYGAALHYIACQITSDGQGGYILKPGFQMDYFIQLILGDKP